MVKVQLLVSHKDKQNFQQITKDIMPKLEALTQTSEKWLLPDNLDSKEHTLQNCNRVRAFLEKLTKSMMYQHSIPSPRGHVLNTDMDLAGVHMRACVNASRQDTLRNVAAYRPVVNLIRDSHHLMKGCAERAADDQTLKAGAHAEDAGSLSPDSREALIGDALKRQLLHEAPYP